MGEAKVKANVGGVVTEAAWRRAGARDEGRKEAEGTGVPIA